MNIRLSTMELSFQIFCIIYEPNLLFGPPRGMIIYQCGLWFQSRSFAMRLSKSAVYNPHKCDMNANDANVKQDTVSTTVIDRDIVIKDHFFDTSDRRRCKPRQAKPCDIVIDGTMTGERGVRENYRVVTSRILPM